jgi:hypothetical protein
VGQIQMPSFAYAAREKNDIHAAGLMVMRTTMHKKPLRDKNGRAGFHTPGLRKGRTASVKDLLGRPGLKALVAVRPEPGDWRSWLATQLPEELAAHLGEVLRKPAELVVYAENAAWSSRLRYAMAALMPQIQQREAQLQRVLVRITPPGRGTSRSRD